MHRRGQFSSESFLKVFDSQGAEYRSNELRPDTRIGSRDFYDLSPVVGSYILATGSITVEDESKS
mgnify:CR=1 FL=1